jgi:methylated-DNA-[protein]-cysteine S-methyltransferase
MLYSMFDTELGTCGVVLVSPDAQEFFDINITGLRKDIKKQNYGLYPGSKEATPTSPNINELISEITDYLEGAQVTFTPDLIDTSAFYPFQSKVMKMDWKIPRGRTATYGWVAKQIGTKGVRAVGNANARNPFPLVYPCHRVIRSDRTLGGFGGGLEMKRQLLEMEGVAFDSTGRVRTEHILT